MDVVYPYRKSRWNDNELRFSLRSVEKHLPHGTIFIVGYMPTWVRNAEHIAAKDSYNHKTKNAIAKIRAACRDPRVSEKFVLMNDDFFILQHMKGIAPVSEGPITAKIDQHKTRAGYYYTSLCDTLRLLHAAGFERPLSYEVHYPIVIDKARFLQLTDSVEWEEVGYQYRSLYGNTYAIGDVRKVDAKCYQPTDLDRFSGQEVISITDRLAMFAKTQRFLYERFPMPSKYEDPASDPGKLP